ncbi:PAS domain S-box-containing protein [Mucilaginibacter mallensis]|uniref:histidine kinase n=1 Tax=Mucilaginibacter mallensis TaxID=652787 RepID=A0A1H1T2T2_MUCMA|nr:PAS domain S-box protein [Mucilaginibacter mallensis]SDS54585.1 PAS domain S-box-containing protein [Mucilaginibacter mallensis]
MQAKYEIYQKAASLVNLGIWEQNLVTGEIYWDEVVREIYEVSPDFAPTLDNSLAFYTDGTMIRKLLAARNGEQVSGRLQLNTAKNNTKWVEVRVAVSATIIYGTITDITAQIALDSKVAEQGEQFHYAFEYAPIGMALVSTAGQWMRVNQELCRILGFEADELLRLTFQDITHPDDLNVDLKQMYELLDSKISSYQMDKRYFHKNGHVIWVSLNVTLVRDQQEKPLYFVSHIKDITELKEHMQLISAQNRRLLNFANVVSHNIRSHTVNIQMLSELIGQETDPAEKEKLITMLGTSAASLQATLVHLNEIVDSPDGEL